MKIYNRLIAAQAEGNIIKMEVIGKQNQFIQKEKAENLVNEINKRRLERMPSFDLTQI